MVAAAKYHRGDPTWSNPDRGTALPFTTRWVGHVYVRPGRALCRLHTRANLELIIKGLFLHSLVDMGALAFGATTTHLFLIDDRHLLHHGRSRVSMHVLADGHAARVSSRRAR